MHRLSTVQSLPEKMRVLRPPGTRGFRELFFALWASQATTIVPTPLGNPLLFKRGVEGAVAGCKVHLPHERGSFRRAKLAVHAAILPFDR